MSAKTTFILFCCGFIFILLMLGSINKHTPETKKTVHYSQYTITANDLYSAYDNNSVAADSKYKNTWCTVTGIVQDIGTGILGKPYVIIGGTGFLDGVQCVFNRGDERTVGRISKGTTITVFGKVSGILGNVIMMDCVRK